MLLKVVYFGFTRALSVNHFELDDGLNTTYGHQPLPKALHSRTLCIRCLCTVSTLYWLLKLYFRPATGDYLVCHTGTLAQGFMLWCPGAIAARASHQTFIAVYQSIVGHRTIAMHTCQ